MKSFFGRALRRTVGAVFVLVSSPVSTACSSRSLSIIPSILSSFERSSTSSKLSWVCSSSNKSSGSKSESSSSSSMCLDDPSPRSPCEKKKELGCGTAKALEPLSLLRGHGRFKRPYILRWARPILPEGFVLTRPPPKALCPPVPAQSHPPTGELNTTTDTRN